MEIVTAPVSSISEIIFNRLFDAAGRQIGYLLNYNDNIKALEKQAQKLKAARDSIQVRIDAAERNREIILPDVRNWISDVGKVNEEAERFLDDEGNANKMCFRGWCINLRLRYRFSKVAKQKIAEITQLQEHGKFQTLSQPAPRPSGIISPTVGFSGIFKSRESIKNEIMEAFKDDKVSIIGICGMGGVGKTTLVKQVGILAKEQKLFDSIVMVVVSQTPNIMNIQREIAHTLDLKSLSDCPESTRASSLWERIKKEKRILIILDDIWRRIQLEEIGIPFGKDHGGCKIMLTSRRKNVCDQMDCDKTFIVGTLTKQESWALFKELVGMDVENSNLSSIAREVTAECDGLPIAIVTLARALKNRAMYVWRDALQQLKRSTSTNVEGMHKNVISSLKWSYNFLESEEKSVFLFCSVFPEDFVIPVEVLVRYGTGLRWFKDLGTIDDIRVRTHAIVSNLISSFLLIGEEFGEEYGEKSVKMHDVVRDVAHIIAPEHNHTFLVKAGISLKEWPERDTFEDLMCISLMLNDIKEVPNAIECPKLQSLLLQRNSKLVVPNNFFQGMKNLGVLDLSETQLSPLPESLSSLVNLRTLYFNGCKLGDLSIIGDLSKLEILSLYGSNVREIPISFNRLTHLRLLDLNYCNKLTRIPPSVISSLCKLEELYVLESFRLWDLEGDGGDSRSNAKLAELQFLYRITSLEIIIPNLNFLIDNDVPFKNLSSFTIIIGALENTEKWNFMRFPGKYSRKLMISYNNEVLILRLLDCLKNLVIERTECLHIIGLDNIFHDLVNRGLNELKGLAVLNQKVIFLVNILECSSNLSFHNLEFLQIIGNPNLVEICHGEPSIQSFNKLKNLTVDGCDGLLNIVPSNLLWNFQSLEYLRVTHCNSMAYIFDCKEAKVVDGETKMLSSLKILDLDDLANMTHIWMGDTQFINLCNLKRLDLYKCPKLIKLFSRALLQSLVCLEIMSIHYCDNLEEIFIMKEEEDLIPPKKDLTTTLSSLGNLSSIHISYCSKLKKLFTPSIVKSLVKLRGLTIVECSTLEEIITNEEASSSSIERIVFPSLFRLGLRWLNNLGCFSSGSYSIEFPILETLDINKCLSMKIFGYGEQLTPKLKKVKLNSTYKELWMDNLNSTIQQLFKEQQVGKFSVARWHADVYLPEEAHFIRSFILEEINMNEKGEKAAACISREDGVPSLTELKHALFEPGADAILAALPSATVMSSSRDISDDDDNKFVRSRLRIHDGATVFGRCDNFPFYGISLALFKSSILSRG
ncbi:disease resistance protein SUMM2-like [Mangifera indica]|uniref:disease resistance protein SUMM2-like n=1 Tax=Mangifera indica TaxID=29780 RepID=UPI001CFBEF84|nr:disease resistance protein SUMM2-like [Mangifera indica]